MKVKLTKIAGLPPTNQEGMKISTEQRTSMKHLVIPDGQVKEGVPMEHWEWIGKYIVEKKPDVIVNIGDFADMESLSTYDKGKKSFEGRRYKKDIKSARKAMNMLLSPLKAYNKKASENHHKRYKPRMVMTLGNHEYRIIRACEAQPELDGVIGYHDLPYRDWEVHDFLKPVCIDGIQYAHYFVNQSSLKKSVLCGNIDTKLKNTGHSFVMGHQQQLQYGVRYLATGEALHGIVAGSCYLHDEDYMGYQGNHYWRGIVMLHDAHDGKFDPMFISLDYLRKRYEK